MRMEKQAVLPGMRSAPLSRAPVAMMARPAVAAAKSYGFGTIEPATAERIMIYGAGGIGKSSLALSAPGPVAYFDLDESLPHLLHAMKGLDVRPLEGVTNW